MQENCKYYWEVLVDFMVDEIKDDPNGARERIMTWGEASNLSAVARLIHY